MKKTLLSLIALGVFATSFAGTIAYNVTRQATIWVYQDGSNDQTSNPQCLGEENICAREFIENPDGSLTPTDNTLPGQRND